MPSPVSKPEVCHPDRQQLIEQLSERYSSSGIRKRQLNRLLGSGLWLIWVQIVTGVKRLLDLLVSSCLILFLAPVLLILWSMDKSRGGGIVGTQRLGRWGCIYRELAFRTGPFRALPALFNVWKGDISLVGPRAVSPGDVSPADRAAWRRFNIRPGLICLWWIRQRTNIAYGSESEVDSEYLDSQSIWGDLAIGLRAIPAAFYGEGISAAPDRIDFLGIPIDNLTMDEAIEQIILRAHRPTPSQVCFVNADCVNISWRDAGYSRILQSSGMVLADGIGVKLAGRILNTNIRQNVNGTDLFPLLCAEMERQGTSLYLLGGKPGVAADVAGWISRNYPGLNTRGHQHGFFAKEDTAEILRGIRDSGADILLVAFGAPRQDKWIREHLGETGARLSIGVGGLFDFYSGRISRAPIWMREIGMEWFYRFLQEPRRMWRRYFVGNAVFLSRVLLNRRRGGAAA
ncbi:MAG: N-acetylglucosaminyldiphosphoundecaprenol N-acetyl-beta-D-mannosaminyltransferase [Bryobacterales bacterium]|nr:N-acetylglucosaminyldiphosphoundecaprenol N-acetyl-beta-D-mannosaminyltransferase [Bryobacterales bacterium]